MSSPKPSLEGAFTGAEAKRAYNRRLFATIAPRYDFITRFLSFGQDRRWKKRLLDLSEVSARVQVLDLACGTGDLAWSAIDRGAFVVGLDITPGMVVLARGKGATKTSASSHAARWLVGDMTKLPVSSATFDLVTTGYGLRNVPDLPAALAEIHRVLKPGGRICSLDFDKPEAAWLRGVYLSYLTLVGSSLGFLLHGDADTYRYIPASIRRYPGARGVVRMMTDSGFTDVRHVPVFGGLMAIHVGVRSSP